MPSSFKPMGPSADGEHWVNINHRCNCGERIPLPQFEGKHCPKCGKYQPTYVEMQASAGPVAVVCCLKCGARQKGKGNFCTECGERIEPGNAAGFNPDACRSCGRSPCECGGKKCVCNMPVCVCGCHERRGEPRKPAGG